MIAPPLRFCFAAERQGLEGLPPPVGAVSAQPARRRPPLRPWHWGLIAGALLLAIVGGARAARGRSVPAVLVEQRPLVQKVVATGRVEPPARVNIGSAVLGTVARVHAEEGDTVRAGQVLLELDAEESEAAVREAEAALEASRARSERLRAVTSRMGDEALRQAEIALERAGAEAARQRTLFEAGAGSRQALDDAERALALARSQRDGALVQALAQRPGGAELRALLAAERQAEAALAGARARLARLRVVAPGEATVLLRDVEPGDIVQPGRTLLVLARKGPAVVEVQPDEKSLAFLAPGQPARISADAFPRESFRGEVASIAPSVDPSRGTVLVKLRVPEPPAYLREGMTVSVDIEVARRASALVVSSEALREEAGQPYVLAVVEGRAARRPVRAGLRGEGAVEILDGLTGGMPVLLPVGPPVPEGTRVRPALRRP